MMLCPKTGNRCRQCKVAKGCRLDSEAPVWHVPPVAPDPAVTPKLVRQIVEGFGFDSDRVQAVSLNWRLGGFVDIKVALLPEFEGMESLE